MSGDNSFKTLGWSKGNQIKVLMVTYALEIATVRSPSQLNASSGTLNSHEIEINPRFLLRPSKVI